MANITIRQIKPIADWTAVLATSFNDVAWWIEPGGYVFTNTVNGAYEWNWSFYSGFVGMTYSTILTPTLLRECKLYFEGVTNPIIFGIDLWDYLKPL